MDAVEWTDLTSSSVRRAAFCPDAGARQGAGRLLLEFRSGRTYEYADVPKSVFEWLLRVPNKGAYVTRMIVGTYAERELDSTTPRGEAVATADLETALRASIERASSERTERPSR